MNEQDIMNLLNFAEIPYPKDTHDLDYKKCKFREELAFL
jgi:hypothetical protein